MPTHLKPGCKLRRTISIASLSEPVIVTLTPEGLEARVAGSRISLFHSWFGVISALKTPGNIPSYLADRPIDFLRYQQSKSKRSSKKERG